MSSKYTGVWATMIALSLSAGTTLQAQSAEDLGCRSTIFRARVKQNLHRDDGSFRKEGIAQIAIAFVAGLAKPLALYIYSNTPATSRESSSALHQAA